MGKTINKSDNGKKIEQTKRSQIVHDAVYDGDLDTIQNRLEQGVVDPAIAFNDITNILHNEHDKKNEIVDLLLEYNALNTKKAGELLNVACIKDHPGIATSLLKNGYKPSSDAAHYSVRNNKIRIFKNMARYAADALPDGLSLIESVRAQTRTTSNGSKQMRPEQFRQNVLNRNRVLSLILEYKPPTHGSDDLAWAFDRLKRDQEFDLEAIGYGPEQRAAILV